MAALDSGHVSGAVLDVFDTEPLPEDHPAWTHPRITITPHVASLASRRARVDYVVSAIGAFERGEALPNLYDPVRGVLRGSVTTRPMSIPWAGYRETACEDAPIVPLYLPWQRQ